MALPRAAPHHPQPRMASCASPKRIHTVIYCIVIVRDMPSSSQVLSRVVVLYLLLADCTAVRYLLGRKWTVGMFPVSSGVKGAICSTALRTQGGHRAFLMLTEARRSGFMKLPASLIPWPSGQGRQPQRHGKRQRFKGILALKRSVEKNGRHPPQAHNRPLLRSFLPYRRPARGPRDRLTATLEAKLLSFIMVFPCENGAVNSVFICR